MNRLKFYRCLIAVFLGTPVAIIWILPITTEKGIIPTIVNGLASTVAITIAFTAALVTFEFGTPEFKDHRDRLVLTMISLTAPIALLWTTYVVLVTVEHNVALKFGLTGLALALYILLDLFFFIGERMGVFK